MTHLQNADFQGANLQAAKLRNANLTDANLEDAEQTTEPAGINTLARAEAGLK